VVIFTGLVQSLGKVVREVSSSDGVRLTVSSPVAGELREGDSIAVNGVCLTAVEPSTSAFKADVMAETLRRSSLGPLGEGDAVNIELPLRAGDRLGGHVVQGHVDGVGVVRAASDDGFSRVVTVDASPELLRYVVEKGSIAVDGVSLTVAAVDGHGFAVALVPHTLDVTTLGALAPGDRVNLEVDILAKYVERLLRSDS
jgi:riboflavin synthase